MFLNNKKGFALIYAILLTGAVLVVGVILMNIITKQLIFSSVNRNSETSYYYAANSGRECLNHYAAINTRNFYRNRPGGVVFEPAVTISCFGKDIIMVNSSTNGTKYYYNLAGGSSLMLDDNKIELFITFNSDCIKGKPSCNGSNLEDRSVAVMKAVGYAGTTSRQTKRVAIQVQQP